MSALQTFAFRDNSVRIVTIDGNPWFVAADVCAILGFKPDNNSYAHHVRYHLGQDERQGYPRTALGLAPGKPIVVISESGLYKLVLRSNKPEARAFQDWVTREVLPSIRKDGGYIAGQEKVRSGEMSELEFLAQANVVAQRVLERMQEGERDTPAALRPSR